MWPWESAVFAYLLYSGYAHLRHRRRPNGTVVLVAAFASILPDVIDKPLAWQFGLLRSGYSVGHSILVGVPVALVAITLARRYERVEIGLGFAIGYVSHIIGDVAEHAVGGDVGEGIDTALWPLSHTPAESSPGVSARTLAYLGDYLHHLATLTITPYFVLVGTIGTLAFVVWIYDGFPGLKELYTAIRWPIARLGRTTHR